MFYCKNINPMSLRPLESVCNKDYLEFMTVCKGLVIFSLLEKLQCIIVIFFSLNKQCFSIYTVLYWYVSTVYC